MIGLYMWHEFPEQSQSVVKQNQCNAGLLSTLAAENSYKAQVLITVTVSWKSKALLLEKIDCAHVLETWILRLSSALSLSIILLLFKGKVLHFRKCFL